MTCIYTFDSCINFDTSCWHCSSEGVKCFVSTLHHDQKKKLFFYRMLGLDKLGRSWIKKETGVCGGFCNSPWMFGKTLLGKLAAFVAFFTLVVIIMVGTGPWLSLNDLKHNREAVVA